MNSAGHLLVVVDDFALHTPGQQLLDRFLIGYPRAGKFHQPAFSEIWLDGPAVWPEELQQRARDFNLKNAAKNAAANPLPPPAIVVASRDAQKLRRAIQSAAPGGRIFALGPLGADLAEGQRMQQLARERQIRLRAGAALAVCDRLPPTPVPRGEPMRQALIVVQGSFPSAEFDALQGLLPLIEQRRGGESGVGQIRYLEGGQLFQAEDAGVWPRRLLEAALSRSDTPQGDPVRDGRTQDLVGLGLVRKLAVAPRGWILTHRDGLQCALLALDGVVKDVNAAIQCGSGAIFSGQLFRAPLPAQDEYHLLAAAVEDFLSGGIPPWRAERDLLGAGILGAMRAQREAGQKTHATPELGVAYAP